MDKLAVPFLLEGGIKEIGHELRRDIMLATYWSLPCRVLNGEQEASFEARAAPTMLAARQLVSYLPVLTVA